MGEPLNPKGGCDAEPQVRLIIAHMFQCVNRARNGDVEKDLIIKDENHPDTRASVFTRTVEPERPAGDDPNARPTKHPLRHRRGKLLYRRNPRPVPASQTAAGDCAPARSDAAKNTRREPSLWPGIMPTRMRMRKSMRSFRPLSGD